MRLHWRHSLVRDEMRRWLSYPATHWRYTNKSLDLIPVPFHGGQNKRGVELGAQALLSAGLEKQLVGLGWEVAVQTELQNKIHELNPVLGTEDPEFKFLNVRHALRVSESSRAVADAVEQAHKAGRLAVTIGGDHSIAMGTLAGTLRSFPEACVVWVDAHTDINSPKTSLSGNMHGCVLSFLMGLDEAHETKHFDKWILPALRPHKIVYIGVRDVDEAEKRFLREHRISAFSMHDIDRHGIGKTVQMALDAVNPHGTLPIHLSFDVDALDPVEAGSTGTPVRGGLTSREGHYITEELARTGQLVSIDLMEVNPSLGSPESVSNTVRLGCSLIRCSLGETLL